MKARKVDRNQSAIVKALRQSGCSVFISSDTGRGMSDLIVGRKICKAGNHTFLIEIKADHKARLTPAQRQFRETWKGHYAVVTNVDEALIAVGIV